MRSSARQGSAGAGDTVSLAVLTLVAWRMQTDCSKPDDIVSLQPGLSAEAQERIVKKLRRKQDEQAASCG